MPTEMTPAERAARVDECKMAIKAQCGHCRGGTPLRHEKLERYTVDYRPFYSDYWHDNGGVPRRCEADKLHDRLRALKG